MKNAMFYDVFVFSFISFLPLYFQVSNSFVVLFGIREFLFRQASVLECEDGHARLSHSIPVGPRMAVRRLCVAWSCCPPLSVRAAWNFLNDSD